MTSPDTPPTEAATGPRLAAAVRPGGALSRVVVELSVIVGRARPLIRDVLDYGPGTVLPLDAAVDAPVELVVGERVIARGLLEEEPGGEGRLAVRITEIAETPEDG